jgi:hypothetical protein
MGILKEPAAFVACLNLPQGFSVCELGNQMMSGAVATPAEPFYRNLGCTRYVSVDGNGRGTVTADLNLSLDRFKLGTFDLVTDFGTGEHIFDQAQVWRSIHDLTTPCGYIVIDRPTEGYSKHCFYLVTHALLQDIAAANDYRIVLMKTVETPRGALVRGIFQAPKDMKAFCVPQQGRYQTSLRIRGAA